MGISPRLLARVATACRKFRLIGVGGPALTMEHGGPLDPIVFSCAVPERPDSLVKSISCLVMPMRLDLSN